MSFTAAKLTFRLHRFAVLGIGLVVLAVSAVAVWYAAQLDAYPAALGCFGGGGAECAGYPDLQDGASRVIAAIGVLPIGAGLFLGVPIVAEELDRSTIRLAWSLEPSRWRWFAQRAMPVIAFALVAGLVAGAAADYLEARLIPFANAGASFHDFGLRGPIVAARLLLVLGCGVLIGAFVGRLLPAMLLALVAGAVLVAAITTVHQGIQAREAVPVDYESIAERFVGRSVDFRYQLASGELVTWEQIEALYPDPSEFERQFQTTTQIAYVIPPERYGEVSAREAAASGAFGLLLVGATIPVVTRRHPGPGRVRFGSRGVSIGARRRRLERGTATRPSPAAALRLALWPHRIELAAGAAVGMVVSVGCLLVVGNLQGLAPPAHCLVDVPDIPSTPDCATSDQFLLVASEWGNLLFASMAALPWVVGALIGVVIVGREIDQGTATLAWSLSPDRRRWLLPRVVVAAGLVILVLAVPSVLATEMQRIARPWVPPESTFDNYALRGPLVVMRAVVAFAIALLAGAWLGRLLPGLLLAAFACVPWRRSSPASSPSGRPLICHPCCSPTISRFLELACKKSSSERASSLESSR